MFSFPLSTEILDAKTLAKHGGLGYHIGHVTFTMGCSHISMCNSLFHGVIILLTGTTHRMVISGPHPMVCLSRKGGPSAL